MFIFVSLNYNKNLKQPHTRGEIPLKNHRKQEKVIFFEKKCRKNLAVQKMVVILHRNRTEISSSGLGRRPLTAETRVRVPVSLRRSAFTIR